MSTRKPAYHHGDLRRALLDAALEIIGSEGAGALSLREAARRAGVSHAAPYRHFESKEALVAAVAEEGFRTMVGQMREAQARAPDDAGAQLQAIGCAYVLFAVAHPAHFRVMFSSREAAWASYPGLVACGSEAFGALVEAIGSCQKAGLIPPGDIVPLALTAWSTVHGLASLLVDGAVTPEGYGAKDAEALCRTVTDTLMRGLISGAGSAAPRGEAGGREQ